MIYILINFNLLAKVSYTFLPEFSLWSWSYAYEALDNNFSEGSLDSLSRNAIEILLPLNRFFFIP